MSAAVGSAASRRYLRTVGVRRWLFGLVLGASLATNAYLLHARARPTPKAHAASTERHDRRRGPDHRRPAVQADAPISDAITRLDRTALEERVRVAEAKVDAALPLPEKFEHATGGPENEARVRPVLDVVFGVEGSAAAPYELECRGVVCRLASDRPLREWQETVQEEMLGLAHDMLFGDAVYFRVDDAATAAGKQYVIDIANALGLSPALAACKRGQAEKGTVVVHLQLVARQVEVSVNGPLAGAPVGSCIRGVVEDVVRATPVPDDLTSLPFNDLPVAVP